MSRDLPSTETILNTADTTSNLVNKFVVSPVVNLGIAGFEFDIFTEHKSELKAQITDHFVEDNSTRQDHIAVLPEMFTLRGFVGEVVDRQAEPKSEVTELAEKLTIINSYIPVITGAARQLNSLITDSGRTKEEFIDQSIGTGVDLFQAYKELNPPDTEQAKAYNFFLALFNAKQLVAVDTPFGFKSDFAIENVVSIQGDNQFITDFAVTLKEFRTASTQLVDFDVKQAQGRAANQKAEQLDQGVANGSARNSSFAFDNFSGLLNLGN